MSVPHVLMLSHDVGGKLRAIYSMGNHLDWYDYVCGAQVGDAKWPEILSAKRIRNKSKSFIACLSVNLLYANSLTEYNVTERLSELCVSICEAKERNCFFPQIFFPIHLAQFFSTMLTSMHKTFQINYEKSAASWLAFNVQLNQFNNCNCSFQGK